MHRSFNPITRTRLTALGLSLLCCGLGQTLRATTLEGWVTTADLRQALSPTPKIAFRRSGTTATERIEIRDDVRFQTLFGMGGSLEGSTCSNLWRMSPADRDQVMTRLVDPRQGIGMNLMRVCIGTSDFTGDPWYSYCDLPPGQTDPELKTFSIERDRAYLLPVIKSARRLNPHLRFFASPWSPPGWMKSSGNMTGGHLLPQWYPAYAQYFIKFIRAYEAEGIPIHAITVQNEPGVDRGLEKDPKWYYPSCRWTGTQERDFIRDHLGPALRRAGLKTRIWCYDHNYNLEAKSDSPGLDYPRTILKDPRAAGFVDGVGFHGYEGKASGMTLFHDEFPKTPIHFTEGSVFSIYGARDLIDRFRNWACSYNAWVLMLDTAGKPNNGPFPATHAAISLNTNTLQASYLLEYHVYGHFMKFLPRGSVRIDSIGRGLDPEVTQVAFRTPEGHRVLILSNPSDTPHTIDVVWNGRSCSIQSPAKSVATWRWRR